MQKSRFLADDSRNAVVQHSSLSVTTTRRAEMSTFTTRDPAPAGARRTVAAGANYEDAERAVDWLSDQGFPVERVSIVGTGLHSVEHVIGRVTTGRAAAMGAAQGAWLGLLFGLFFGVFFSNAAAFFGVVLYGLVAGIVWGALLRAIFQYMQRGRRDFGSVTETRADRYEVQVDDGVAGEAERLLGRMPPNAGLSVGDETDAGS
jgi:hypothetical protein